MAQKYMAGSGEPSGRVTALTMAPNGPLTPALSMAITGMMVRKMPANSLATSCIGPQPNWLLSCTALGVSQSDSNVTATRPRSRTMPGRPTSVPAMLNTTEDFQKPLISTSATTTPSKPKLCLPSKPMPGVSGVGSRGSISSRLW